MMNLEQLREYLTESKADCEIIEHEKPILKTKDAAEYFDLELCAPVFVIATQQGLVAMVMSAQRTDMDVSSIKTVLGYDVKGLADPKAVSYTHLFRRPIILSDLDMQQKKGERLCLW